MTTKTKKKPDVSRQLAWQRDQAKAGKCWRCGGKKGKSPYKCCVKCAKADRDRKRKHDGSKPWRLGKRGRPPKTAKVKTKKAA